MSLHFHCNDEDSEKEESIDNYIDLFKEYVKSPPTLRDVLNHLFISSGVLESEFNDYIDHLIDSVNRVIEKKKIK